jgi:circadian clock protein KaiC
MKKRAKDLLATGITGLDEIFLGGVKQHNIILVEGSAGTGKTTLGLEFIYRGARDLKECGLIISFERTPEKILRDARGFGWDFEGLIRKNRVKIITMSPMVFAQELQSEDSVLLNEIRALNATRVLIDGLTPLRLFDDRMNGRPFRDTLQLLVEKLQEHQVTAILTRELPEIRLTTTSEVDHEQFVCDSVITLSNTTNSRSTHRYLEIKKSRGQDFMAGQHTMRIHSEKGIQVYCRTLARPKELIVQPTSVNRSSTGIPALDEIMGGGIYEGSTSLVVGISGTGKTVMGIQFLVEGAKEGKKGVLVTCDEHPRQLIRNAQTLGLDLQKYIDEGLIYVLYDSPLELELDVHFHKIIGAVEKMDARRIVIDSVATYESASTREAHEFMYALTTYFKNKLVTTFCNYESPELLGLSQISKDLKASAIVDNIVLLTYVEISTQMRRAITVPKVRGAKIPQKTREFVIEEGGVRLLDDERDFKGKLEPVPQLPFSSYYGVLSRAPERKSPVIEESIASGEGLPESTPMS